MDNGGALSWALWLTAAALLAQDPSETLEKARGQLLAKASHLPNYTCVETIDRSYYSQPASRQSCEHIAIDRKKGRYKLNLAATDRLRVRVGFQQDREIYSWIGLAPLAHPVDDILEPGPMETGAFAAHLLDIFSNPGVRFRLMEEKREALEYGFRVPVEASRMRVAAGPEWVLASYTGSFDIDRRSLEVRRFTIETGELPPETSLCEATATHQFQPHPAGGSGWFVPMESRSQQVMRDATETDRSISFSDCSESMPAPSTPRRLSDPLPPGLPVSVVFTAAIHSDVAAAGDTISATLTQPVVAGSKVLAPTGAILTGRIIQMKHQLAAMENGPHVPRAFVISVAFDTLEANGVVSPFYATPVGQAQTQIGNQKLKDWPHGTFVFPTGASRYVVPVPFESRWRTVAPPAPR
jgi:hypothetical protein